MPIAVSDSKTFGNEVQWKILGEGLKEHNPVGAAGGTGQVGYGCRLS
jgi:hypothetical protein